MAACSATNLPRVDDVLATLQVSSHKCKVMFYTEVLGSEDFRLVAKTKLILCSWFYCCSFHLPQFHSFSLIAAHFDLLLSSVSLSLRAAT